MFGLLGVSKRRTPYGKRGSGRPLAGAAAPRPAQPIIMGKGSFGRPGAPVLGQSRAKRGAGRQCGVGSSTPRRDIAGPGASALRFHIVVQFPEDRRPARRPVLGQTLRGDGCGPGGWASGVGRPYGEGTLIAQCILHRGVHREPCFPYGVRRLLPPKNRRETNIK